MTYLSIAPEGLREAFITGGLSPVGRPPDDVYAATWVRLIEKNRAYFERYPDDRERVARHPRTGSTPRTSASRPATGSPRAASASWASGSATARAGSCSTT